MRGEEDTQIHTSPHPPFTPPTILKVPQLEYKTHANGLSARQDGHTHTRTAPMTRHAPHGQTRVTLIDLQVPGERSRPPREGPERLATTLFTRLESH